MNSSCMFTSRALVQFLFLGCSSCNAQGPCSKSRSFLLANNYQGGVCSAGHCWLVKQIVKTSTSCVQHSSEYWLLLVSILGLFGWKAFKAPRHNDTVWIVKKNLVFLSLLAELSLGFCSWSDKVSDSEMPVVALKTYKSMLQFQTAQKMWLLQHQKVPSYTMWSFLQQYLWALVNQPASRWPFLWWRVHLRGRTQQHAPSPQCSRLT